MVDYEAVLRETLAEGSARFAVYGYLLTGSQDAGEELVQEAVVKVFSRRRRRRRSLPCPCPRTLVPSLTLAWVGERRVGGDAL